MIETVPVRRPRKDAQINREQILEAARMIFAQDGVGASMDAIGKQARVGPGTLYRHFPTKDALLAALLEAHFATLEQKQDIIAANEPHAGRALEQWIEALGDWMLAFDGLPEPLRSAMSDLDSPLRPTCQSVQDATGLFLHAAQDAGVARLDLTPRDVFLAALAIAWASGAEVADERTRAVTSSVLKTGWMIAN